MVFASICEHAEHCDFFASMSRNEKFALQACDSNAKIWGAQASEHSFKFCEQLKILMDHSSPLALYKIKNYVNHKNTITVSITINKYIPCGSDLEPLKHSITPGGGGGTPIH